MKEQFLKDIYYELCFIYCNTHNIFFSYINILSKLTPENSINALSTLLGMH